MQFSARTRIAKTNTPSIERSFYLLNTRTICAIFLYYWTQWIDGFSFLLQRYVRKAKDAKNPAFLSFFIVTERTQLNAAYAQMLEKLRPIALAEICRFLTIQSIEFQDIWQKNSSENTWMIYHKETEFWHWEFLIIQNMQWKFTANYENRYVKILLQQCWQKGFSVNS